MFYLNYLTKFKVHMHDGAIRTVLYGCAYVREIIHSLKLVDYLPVNTHKQYNNLHLLQFGMVTRNPCSVYCRIARGRENEGRDVRVIQIGLIFGV